MITDYVKLVINPINSIKYAAGIITLAFDEIIAEVSSYVPLEDS